MRPKLDEFPKDKSNVCYAEGFESNVPDGWENLDMKINNLPIGTKLIWDAPEIPLIVPEKRFAYPATLTERHYNKQWVKVKIRKMRLGGWGQKKNI